MRIAAMKPIGYILAGAAALFGLSSARPLPDPAALPNGWNYKGRYS
jgi:hypothetical protein